MARTHRSTSIETRTSRSKLATGKRFWINVGEGIALCYRRTEKGFGTWTARLWLAQQYRFTTLGEADDYRDADGEIVLSYYQAFDKARVWAAQETRNPIQYKNLTVKQAAERYMEWYKIHRKGYRNTRIAVDAHIIPVFGDRSVSELKTREIREWHEQIAKNAPRKRGQKSDQKNFYDAVPTPDGRRARKASANRMLTILKAILNKAYHDELIQDNLPWKRVKPFENTDEPIIRFLKEDECQRLINVSSSSLRALIKAGLFTGARYGELTHLFVEDVNLDIGKNFIRPSKSGKGRHIPLSAEGRDFFKAQIMGRLSDQHVFMREDGKVWGKDYQHRPLREACKQAGIIPAIGFHELRHTYASLLAQRGADLLTISKLLGHADTRITSRHYAHLCDKTLANTVELLLPAFGHTSENSNVKKLTKKLIVNN
jgi:site-specific recombinase XerD